MSKELSSQEFIEGIQTPTTKLNITQLRQREEFWRAMWSWLPDNVKYFTLRVGQQIRVIKRDWKGQVGELGQVSYEPKELETSVYEKVYNYNDGKYYWETKVAKTPFTAITMLEFIGKSESAEDVERFEVTPIPEEEPVVTVGEKLDKM